MNNFENPEFKKEKPIKQFEDLRTKDLSYENLTNISTETLKTINFDTETKWPENEKMPKGFNPEKVIEKNKNPGLKIKELHNQGITGQGINVAIIDQKLDISHPEYKNSLLNYSEHGKAKTKDISMHGPAVISLLAGKNCGVAPEAKILYKALPAGRDFHLQAQTLNEIIKNNEKLTKDKKIKIVNCSIGYMKENPEPGLNEWINTLKKAKEKGIIVIDVNGEEMDISFVGGGSSENKDDFEKYLPWLAHNTINTNKLIIPSDYRTMASAWHKKDQYMYNGKGGISWSIPYLSGLIALTLQVNPKLKIREISEIIKKTVVTNKNNLKIINPKGIIESAKK